jgi:putative ABC transport system ATP-binding protein
LKDGQILEDLTKEHNLYKFKKHQFTKGQILNDEIIQKIQDQFKNIHREGFLPTQEILLDEQPLNVKYISSQLSLKQTFKMGASAFKNKKVLLFFSTLIVSWASAIFSVVLEAFIYAKELAWKFFLNSSLSSIKNYNSQLKPDWLKTYTELKRIEFEQNYVFIIKKFFYVRILLIVFLIIMSLISFMMIYMYFSASIKLKKKEIGSLRALGASGLTVSKIFLSEGFIYATLVNILIFVFSSLGGFATGLSKMTTIRYWFFLGAEYLFVYVLSFLSIALPIYKLSHQKPIDVISNQ